MHQRVSSRCFRPALSFVAVACAIAVGTAHAETRHDEQVWANLTVMGLLADGIVYFAEIQPRVSDDVSRLDQLILRGALGVQLAPGVTLYQGYAHVEVPVQGGPSVNEERSFQQLNLALGKPWEGELSSRTRLEQRWRSDGSGTGWRLREMLRYEKPLRPQSDAINALVYAEGFFAINDTDWGG